MSDVILSSLLNLFALFSTKNNVDKELSKQIISNYLIHQFGVRDLESSLALYNDLCGLYEEMPGLDVDTFVSNICSQLIGKISTEEQTLMLLRLMEVYAETKQGKEFGSIFKCVAEKFNIDDALYGDLIAFVTKDATSKNVREFPYDGNGGLIRTLYLQQFSQIVFTYHGNCSITMNDVVLRPGAFRIWQRSGVLKCNHDKTLYYYNVLMPYKDAIEGTNHQRIILCGNHVDFRFEDGSDNGLHDFTFNLHNGELVAIMGSSGVGKSTLLSLLNGTLHPQKAQSQ